ncbi:SAP30-binding protein [Lepeophtheirus salmonis]|uniref:SAP30 binding protein [Latimeria chalumnae] n=1 Tax=Lepeophtheirus salmonis TaxID=72036 RepID=A0A0K2URR9_LEPSM|nr:SAP30-binding protein-like [Lepeophtheirus salmonis]CAB4067068.1 SAP30-binding protein [Lepeophtheirus salmonis]CAF2981497.1 SAP30-binding protein [Lepeophtheirus salmonis]
MSLASLTANYTDSEDEDTDPPPPIEPLTTKETPGSESVSNKSTPTRKISKLVSYNDEDEDLDDEENGKMGMEGSVDEEKEGEGDEEDVCNPLEEDNVAPVPMDLESPQNDEEDKIEEEKNGGEQNSSGITVEAWTDGVQLPPEPLGECDPSLQEKITKLMMRKTQSGYDINSIIQQKKNFRNPSIYEKLIEYCEIDEHGTNLPKDLYDGHLFGKESYYEELAKVQKIEIERRDKIAKHKKETAEAIFKRQQREATEAAVAAAANVVKRKTKWNQVPTTTALPQIVRPAPILVSASATATQTAKTIPAFGALHKQ